MNWRAIFIDPYGIWVVGALFRGSRNVGGYASCAFAIAIYFFARAR